MSEFVFPHHPPATRFHLTNRSGLCTTSHHRGEPSCQFQPVGRLPQQQDPRRGHFPVNSSPNGMHAFPEHKDKKEQGGERSFCLAPRSHTPLGTPARGAPQHDTPHQNDTRPTGILSTPPPRTGPARDNQIRVRCHARGRHGSAFGRSLVISATHRP